MGLTGRQGQRAVHGAPLGSIDVRVRLVGLLAATIALFGSPNPWVVAALAMTLVPLCLAARMPGRAIVRGLRTCLVVLAVVLVVNALVLDGTGDITLLGPVGISGAGLLRGLLAVVRIMVAVVMALVLVATTDEGELGEALCRLLAPLGRLGLPVADVAQVLSLCLRFVPLSIAELTRIRDGQDCRGAGLETGGVLARIGRWRGVLVALLVALFRRTRQVARAMEARGYGSGPMTALLEPLPASGWVESVVLLALAVGCLCLPWAG